MASAAFPLVAATTSFALRKSASEASFSRLFESLGSASITSSTTTTTTTNSAALTPAAAAAAALSEDFFLSISRVNSGPSPPSSPATNSFESILRSFQQVVADPGLDLEDEVMSLAKCPPAEPLSSMAPSTTTAAAADLASAASASCPSTASAAATHKHAPAPKRVCWEVGDDDEALATASSHADLDFPDISDAELDFAFDAASSVGLTPPLSPFSATTLAKPDLPDCFSDLATVGLDGSTAGVSMPLDELVSLMEMPAPAPAPVADTSSTAKRTASAAALATSSSTATLASRAAETGAVASAVTVPAAPSAKRPARRRPTKKEQKHRESELLTRNKELKSNIKLAETVVNDTLSMIYLLWRDGKMNGL